eukprot:scaffold7052_cov46-Prasinocladus_malaysianus.AAC.1
MVKRLLAGASGPRYDTARAVIKQKLVAAGEPFPDIWPQNSNHTTVSQLKDFVESTYSVEAQPEFGGLSAGLSAQRVPLNCTAKFRRLALLTCVTFAWLDSNSSQKEQLSNMSRIWHYIIDSLQSPWFSG